MTTEEKALALLNEVQGSTFTSLTRDSSAIEALCRAIEQHEAFRREVSDVVYRSLMSIAKGCAADAAGDLSRFVIPAPKRDPLEDVLEDICIAPHYAKIIRASLGAIGFEIREKNDDN